MQAGIISQAKLQVVKKTFRPPAIVDHTNFLSKLSQIPTHADNENSMRLTTYPWSLTGAFQLRITKDL